MDTTRTKGITHSKQTNIKILFLIRDDMFCTNLLFIIDLASLPPILK
jgi:hypothetical protein